MATNKKEKKSVRHVKINLPLGDNQGKPEAIQEQKVGKDNFQAREQQGVIDASDKMQNQNEGALESVENVKSQMEKVSEDPKEEGGTEDNQGKGELLQKDAETGQQTQEQQGVFADSEKIRNESSSKLAAGEKNQTVGAIENSKKEGEKKDKLPATITLKDKSELFKRIIDIALSCEALTTAKKKLKEKNALLEEKCRKLAEENNYYIQQLKEAEISYKAKQAEISELKIDVAHRDEAIDIIKADKTESAQEYKNALSASLKPLYADFEELKEMGTSDDVGLAVIEVFEGVLKVLEKNGIAVGK